jgi:hypothetical protein
MTPLLQTSLLFACLAMSFPLTISAQRSAPIPQYGKPLKCAGPTALAPPSPNNHLIVRGAAGAGTMSNPWTNWEDKVNAMPENSLIEFQVGWYARSKTIAVKRGWKIHGKGIGLSNLLSQRGATKVAFLANYPGNCSTAVYNVIQQLSILDNGQGGEVAYADVGGTFVDVNHIRVQGFKIGVLLDQSEIVTVQTNIFEEQALGCLWVVNGDDFTPGNQRGYSNVIHVTNGNQFFPLPTGVGIIHDGGYTFTNLGNSHNGGKHYVYIAGMQTAVIGSCHMEGAGEDGIVTEYRAYFSRKDVGPNNQLAIRDNTIVTTNAHCLRHGYFSLLENNLISSRVAAILCGGGVTGAQFQVSNSNSYGGGISSCAITEHAYFWLNTQDKQINTTLNKPSNSALAQSNVIAAPLDFTALRASSCEELPITGFRNLKTTDFVQVALPPELTSGSTTFNWYIRDANTVVLRRCNLSPAQTTPDPPPVTVRVKVEP